MKQRLKPLSQNQKKKPIFECLNIRVTAQDFRLNQPFVKVGRMIAFFEWAAITVDYHQFAGSAALTNGIQITVDDRPLFSDTFKALRDFMRYSYDTDFKIDSAGVTKHAYFASRLSFHKFMGNEEGVDLRDYDMVVNIQDDLLAIGTDLALTFEGWAWDK